MSTRRGRVIPKMENRERRSPRNLRTKTPSVNELRKKFKVSPRGKRKLDFVSKGPLAGKTFYLDLKGYRHPAQLKKTIGELGGGIEEFFHKDVSYLVTNRKDADNGKSPSSQSMPSPGIPSPSLFARSSSVKGTAIPSPMSTDSPQSIESRHVRPSHDTRGRVFVKNASAGQKRGTTDILSNANTWGVNVFYLDQVLKWISQLMPKTRQRSTGKQQSSSTKRKIKGKIPKVVTLQDSFLKVEDLSFKYRPLVHEFKVWPEITFDGSVMCPFDPPRQKSSENDMAKRKSGVETKSLKKFSVQERPKHGYCECCEVRYNDLDFHLKGDQHQTFARTDSNYASLDRAISDGPTLKDFLNEFRLRKTKDRPSSVEQKSSLSISMQEIDDEVNDEVFLLPTPTQKLELNQAEVKNERLCCENSVKATMEESIPSLKSCLNKNFGDVGVKEDIQNIDTSLLCRKAIKDRSTAFCEPSSTATHEEPRRTTRSRVSLKQESFNSSEKRRTLPEVKYHLGETSGSTFFKKWNDEEDGTDFVTAFRRSKRLHDKESSNGLLKSAKTEQNQSDVLQQISENSVKSCNKHAQSRGPGPLVLDANERINRRYSHRRKRDIDDVKCCDGLRLSPILPCNPTGCSVMSSCSVDASFHPSGLPVYSSLGSSFDDVRRGVNFLIERTENESNSEYKCENIDPSGCLLASSSVSAKFSPKTPPTSSRRDSGSDEKSCSVVQSSNGEKAVKSVLHIPLAYLDPNTITGHDSAGSGNENDSPLIKRKRSPNDDEEYNKARKCKRVSEESPQDSEAEEDSKWTDFSTGFTSEEGSQVTFRPSIAERVKLQRALSESYQVSSKTSFLECPKSSPTVTTFLKRRSGFTSTPFVELTNTGTKRRERAKSDGRLLNFSRTTRRSHRRWNENSRSEQSLSACLTPNDPYSFNDL